jgi:hypothetical protein
LDKEKENHAILTLTANLTKCPPVASLVAHAARRRATGLSVSLNVQLSLLTVSPGKCHTSFPHTEDQTDDPKPGSQVCQQHTSRPN